MKAAIVKTNSIIEIKNLEKVPLDPHEISCQDASLWYMWL